MNDELKDGDLLAGRRIVTCPAGERIQCANCGLCAKPDRQIVVRFHVHGTAKNKARAALAAVNVPREAAA